MADLNKHAKVELKKLLMEHEGFRSFPYEDTTGNLTIGWGHNLTSNGLSPAAAAFIFEEDLEFFIKTLPTVIHFWDSLNDARQIVLVNMAFNLGIKGLLSFKKALGHMESGEFVLAGRELMASKWADQVGNRAVTLARIMRTGCLEASKE